MMIPHVAISTPNKVNAAPMMIGATSASLVAVVSSSDRPYKGDCGIKMVIQHFVHPLILFLL